MLPMDSNPTTPPTWSRFKDIARRSTSSELPARYRARFMNSADKLQRSTMTSYRKASDTYRSLSLLQRVLLFLAAGFGIAVLLLFLRFGESVFAWIAPLAQRWRGVRGGWLVLWVATFGVGMPPLIGYSSCVAVAGFVYGMWHGWLIVASATILGSTTSFLISRHLLSNFVHRLIAHDRRFAALSLTLKHDGIKLLMMIRLCPLPYSLSNGALATFPTVTWQSFMLATALATPKLLIHTFIGSRLAKIADDMDDMDAGTKAVNWMSIGLSMAFGAGTAWFIYRQTKRRAAELEALEGAGDGRVGARDDEDSDYEEEYEGQNRLGGVSAGNRYVDDSSDVSSPLSGYRDEHSGDERR